MWKPGPQFRWSSTRGRSISLPLERRAAREPKSFHSSARWITRGSWKFPWASRWERSFMSWAAAFPEARNSRPSRPVVRQAGAFLPNTWIRKWISTHCPRSAPSWAPVAWSWWMNTPVWSMLRGIFSPSFLPNRAASARHAVKAFGRCSRF